MNPEQFHEARREDWAQLEYLLRLAKKGFGRFSAEKVQELGHLYRATASDLALAQRDFPNHKVTQYLNQLVAQAHAVVYRDDPLNVKRFLHFYTYTFPRLFRESWRFVLISALLFFVPGIFTVFLTAFVPQTARAVLPQQMEPLIQRIEARDLWVDIEEGERPSASSYIMTNNIRVTILTFAGGMTAGVLTIYVLLSNAITIGAVLGLTIHHGVGWGLGNFMVAHGVIELTMIVISGAAGMMIGWSILKPGFLSRRDAITQASGKAVRLMVGVASFLVIAGIIEGFVSPSALPAWVKWLVGGVTGLMMVAYFGWLGRESSSFYPDNP